MKKIIALLMMACMLFAVAGCGAEKTDDKETIVVGYTIYEPMNYLDENGELVGYDTELAKKVFENLGYNVTFKEINWDNKYSDLSGDVIDCIWNGFTCNAADDDGIQRSEKVDFSYNYMENRQVVVVDKSSTIKSAADLKGKIGMAEAGSAGETYAKSFGDIVFKGVGVQTDGLLQVNSKTADFAVVDAQLAKSYCGKGDYANLVIVDALSSDVEYYAVGFEKGSELTVKVNEQFEKLGKDGTIEKLAKKYDVATTAIKDFSDQVK